MNAEEVVRFDSGYVKVKIPGRWYPIEMDRIQSPERLLGWVVHLGRVKAVDGKVLAEFIERVSKEKGWYLWSEK